MNEAVTWTVPIALALGALLHHGCRGEGCPPPTHTFNFSVLPVADHTDQVQEVMFMGVVGPFDEKRVCKIKCVDGRWVGPLCSMQHDSGRFQSMFRPCHVHNIPKHTVITYKDRQITPSPELEFPHESVISGRCEEPGRFKLLGDSRLTCNNAKWKGRFPVCIHTNHFTNYSDDAPPALEWSVAGGQGMLDVAGSLVLLPGSILHLDCLYPRLHGNPTWAWTSSYRQYPTGWAISRLERELRYRLSLYYAKPDDSGTFTCSAPTGHDNYLHILVKGVSCPPIAGDGVLEVHGDSVGLGTTITFSCPLGYYLNGAGQLTCLPSGEWSSVPPRCLVVQCPVLAPDDPRLQLEESNTTYTGSAQFSCVPGFKLVGHRVVHCTANGTWSHDLPLCKEVLCRAVRSPDHGQVTGATITRKVGEAITYTCDAGYVVRGHSLAFCTQEGSWSHPPPQCVESCAHPGEPQHGHVSPRRPRYHIGATVLVTCRPGYRPAGPDRLTCLHTRRWSSPVTRCVPSFG
ncbi:locomotion-related protein Hikaru genki-like [Penaeus monodon]|uniref:locomotion-related protein Hikaru genki-like n=1 Tax=Penaeus monodon TaxID=6687 RepID=UPI0018A6F6A9|nr:locomotion-related protein Hikaru genki-like [Penaeus monodon]XP_037798369.1 locomotion-related protein Hikaru genki-like [Penaeus monodon]XP_037798370.1 locomotion-related protein Hikaru genki-like [Penaeus monodon]